MSRKPVEQKASRVGLFVAALAVAASLLVTCGDEGGGGGDTDEVVVDTTVFGRVLAAEGETPLPGVTVTAAGVRDSVRTDEQGRFMLPLPAAGTYAVTASLDGYTYAQRWAEAADKELVSVPDMFLTPLDPKEIRIGPEGGRDTNSDGRIELEVPPGALDQTVSMRATWFGRGKQLPNFLPEASHFTYACELTPDGQTFAVPVTVRLQNERGFAPGTPIPVGVYSPETLEWTHESMGEVSADGQWVEVEVSHFSPRDCNLGPQDPLGSGEPGDAEDETDASRRNDQPCGSVAAGSSVDVLDGHLNVDHVLPAYMTLSRAWTVGLRYDSNLHTTLPVLGVSYDISQTSTVVPERMRFLVEVGGQRVERFFLPFNGPMDFAYRWDGRDGIGRQLPDGVYTYRLTLANEYEVEFVTQDRFGGAPIAPTGVVADELQSLEATFEGTVALRRGDPSRTSLGAGWGLIGLHELELSEDRAFITSGEGNQFVFRVSSDTSFEPTAGNLTTLSRQGTGYLWIRHDRTQVVFDAEGRMVTNTDLNGNAITYGYDDGGRLSTRVDPLGGTTTFTYDAAGRLSAITDPYDRTTRFQIDGDGDLVQIANPDGTTRNFTYDEAHRLVSQTDAGGNTTTYQYDSYGAVVRVDHPDDNSSRFSSIGGAGSSHLRPGDIGTDSNPAAPASSTYTNPEGETHAFTVNTFGTRTSITDPLGRTTLMYRDRNDLLSFQRAPGSEEGISYAYDENGNLTVMSGPQGIGGARDNFTFGWDPDLNLVRSVTDDAVGAAHAEYDDRGNLETAVMMDGRSYHFTSDERGLRRSMRIGSRTTEYQYNQRGNLTELTTPTGGTWSISYDQYGNVTAITDPEGRTRSAVYDLMNMLQSITNGVGDIVRITYDPASGNPSGSESRPAYVVASISDGRDSATRFEYDEMYRVRRMTDPLDRSHTLEYDRAGRLERHTGPNGAWIQYAYDASGSLSRKQLSSGETNDYVYDETTGRLRVLSNGVATLTFDYDADGFVSSTDTMFSSSDVTTSLAYEYRTSGYSEFARTLTYGPGAIDYTSFVTSFEPEHGWLPTYISAGDFVGITLYMSYDDGGRLSGWEQSGSWSEALFLYDDDDRLEQATYFDDTGAVLRTLSWTYSPAGLRLSDDDVAFESTYLYDAEGRLTSAMHDHPSNDDESYSYDRAGNRRVVADEAEYAYDSANQLRQDPDYRYTYDANGNRQARTARIGGATTAYEYDSEDRLVRVELPGGEWVRFAYDPLGRLAEKRDHLGAVRRYVYDRDEVLAEFDEAGFMVRRYLGRDAIDMPMIFISGGDHYIAGTDALGTIIGFLDDSGDLAGSYQYQAFGELVNVDGTVANERTFAGRDYDATSGLLYMRARFYDPKTGRFLQRDPLPYQAATAPYVYAKNSPTNYRDPHGREPDAFNETLEVSRFIYKRAGEPLLEKGVEMFGEWVAGSRVGTAIGVAFQFKDIIKIVRADDPGQAAIDWYVDQWWNPITNEMMEAVLTMGGTMPRREPPVAPTCITNRPSDRLVQTQLHSSRTLAQRLRR